MQRVVIVILVAALAAGTWMYFHGTRAATPSSATPASPVVDAMPADDASDSDAGRTNTPARPVRPSTRASMNAYKRYETATDLFPLAQDLLVRAMHGDPDAIGPLDRIRNECFAFMVSPTTRASVDDLSRQTEKFDPGSTGQIESAIARRTARCQRFTRSDLIPSDQRMTLLESAAANGDPQAQARWLSGMTDLDHVPDATLLADVKNIVASGDPQAINDLANVMSARLDGRQQLFDLPAGSETSQWAWVSAACQLGLDCGPGSQLIDHICLNGAGCYPSLDALVRDAVLPPREYRQMLLDEQMILARVRQP